LIFPKAAPTHCPIPVSRVPRHAVLLAGGSGTRFWPRSRLRLPKQLLPIAARRTMLEETAARVAPLVRPARTWVVTTGPQARAVRSLMPAAHLLVEPTARNTAAAVALAAVCVARQSPRAAMAVLPADHAISDVGAFRRDLTLALDVAERTGALVTLGVAPTRPETGYGYIRVGAPIEGEDARVAWVRSFIEKPDRARAEALIAESGTLWNAGIFAWRADAILAALREHLPALLGPIEAAVARGGRAALLRAYRRVPAVSIDTGVLERARRVAVVRTRFAWSDVGSWAALEGLWRDGRPNAVRGRTVAIDSRGCVVDSPTRLVALLGVENLVVVDTPDALLVCQKARAQDVRLMVEELRRRRLGRYL
jgi:mannose-1-phosphate guanylyltransferase